MVRIGEQDEQYMVIRAYAVSLEGDSDNIASIAGAISGAYLGVNAIPAEWKEKLENRDYLLSLAHNLWRVASHGKATKE